MSDQNPRDPIAVAQDLVRAIRPALVRHIHPLLKGHPPEAQSAALADLAATYLAGVAPTLRPEMRRMLFDLIDALVPENERELFGDRGHPARDAGLKPEGWYRAGGRRG